MLQAQGASDAGATADFAMRLNTMLDTALRCEDPVLQDKARAVMPLERLRDAAKSAADLAARLGPDVAAGGFELPALEDWLAKELLHWFKSEFFTWVDTLPCSRCGSTATRPDGAAQPLSEDLAAGASRVELHRCSVCGANMRFPRYNDPGKLLQPGCRRGRCGEWANAFLLCCRAAGLTARYVGDWADHVWTEYYSHRLRRWIHLDSCEESYDQPLLYEDGWGKQVLYVVAAGKWGVTDVTRRYTTRWQREVLPRRTLVPERWLQRRLDQLTTSLRAGWAAPQRLAWLGRDAEERMEVSRGGRPGGQHGARQQQPLPGRQTGSLEWRQQRGETGASSGAPAAARAAAAPAAAPPTSYRLARDEAGDFPPVFAAAGRLSGGACRAAGHNEASEVVERLFDCRTDTKWLDFGGAGPSGSSWVEYRMPIDRQPVVVLGYELVSANDCPERDPAAWQLEAVTEQDYAQGRMEQWTPLDWRSGERFPNRYTALSFQLGAPSPPCRRLRLHITATANPRVANSVQLSCWNLYGPSPTGGRTGASGGGGGSADSSPLQGLRDMVAKVAVTAAGATSVSASFSGGGGGDGGGGGGSSSQPGAVMATTSLSLLVRLLDNIRRNPREPRLRKVRAAKVAELLQTPPLADVLLNYVRFRPLIAPAGAGHAPGSGLEAGMASLELRRGVPDRHDVFLVLANDTSGDDVRRICEVLSVFDS